MTPLERSCSEFKRSFPYDAHKQLLDLFWKKEKEGKWCCRRRVRDIDLFKSHHYRPFDKADKAYKECLSLRPSLTLLLVGILMSPRPTCLALALILLIFLYPRPSSSFLVPSPSPHLVDAINYATAPCAQLHRRLKRSFRFSRYRTDGRRLPRPRENRRRTGLEARLGAELEADEPGVWIWDTLDLTRNLLLRDRYIEPPRRAIV